MKLLSGFFADDLAIDLGTVNTIVYAPTEGIVLNEPSVLAIHKYTREVLSVGSPALKLLGPTVRRVIEDAKPEVTADIYYSGVTLTGGGSLLNGMADRLQNDLRLQVKMADDPLTTVALGAGKLLTEPEKLQRASLRLDMPAWESEEKLVVNW